jgi:CheY-like chemotaxis protein
MNLTSTTTYTDALASPAESLPINAPITVWLIEDSPQWQQALKQWLPLVFGDRLQVALCASSAMEAYTHAEALHRMASPHLVLLDWQLTDGYTGLELGQWLEGHLHIPAQRIVFISEAFPEASLETITYQHIPKSRLMRSRPLLTSVIQGNEANT